ncbi:MAG: hypothetical protein COS08_05290 [Euryarchaeota archaeon CG01_land_8_20_14_3_00_38_12]|nr:MAG: hypothetical protein COS08_05290 [Euryarchaeota archaeon CG01_land_8_20_14_3_00_38_12]PJB22325.1 MAG: hypothetical protein CO114_00660 [Euryarchaeota archaeon CG_4_9_14_3_um_filter_38_12]
MKIPPCKPVFDKDMEKAAINALRNEFFVLGESVFKFEEEFAKYCNTDYAVAVSSGTAALHLSLIALGIKNGDKILTTPMSFIATSNAVIHANATPVFSDIDETWNIDPKKIMMKEGVKCIIPVHLYGRPCNMDEILETAEKNKIFVIEDACQAHGAEYKNRKAGSIGDIGCFSFYSTKNMIVCGDGGMVTTNDKNVAEIIRKLRDCGRKSSYEHDVIGYTARLNTVNAAIGIEQLKKLDGWIKKRRENAEFYRRLLSNIEEITLPVPEKDIKSVYHLFVIRAKRRDKLKEFLKKNEIFCGIHYQIPIHLQPIYRELYKYKGGEFPESEKHAEKCLSLPMFPDLKKNEIEYVCDRIKEFYG